MADPIPDNQTQFDNSRGDPLIDPSSGLVTNDGNAAIALPQEDKAGSVDDMQNPLFPAEQCTSLGNEWQNIQAGFVDAPRVSVQKADALVKKTVGILESSFADMHNSLERNWEKDKQVSTEDLRLALQNYRAFFQRLLSI